MCVCARSVPLFQLLNPLDAPLRIGDHLPKQVCEARLANLGRLGAVERAVIDGLAMARQAETGLLFAWPAGL